MAQARDAGRVELDVRGLLLVAVSCLACRGPSEPTHVSPPDAATFDASVDAPPEAASEVSIDSGPHLRAQTGPFETPFLGKRNVYWVAPRTEGPHRLMAMLHGVCNPPGYTCGLWSETAKDLGFLVCPTGDGSCGPAMYDAPTWNEGDTKIDEDLEKAIATVDALVPGELSREAPVLLGFSRGAYVSVKIAEAHPNRWPYLVLIEATPALSAKRLRAAGVKAVALLAGEIGSQAAGEKKLEKALSQEGFPARYWVMKGAGHHYSNDVDVLLREAVAWATSQK